MVAGEAMKGGGAAGRLVGIGLGPGDPELMTLKAQRLIAAAEVIAYPAANGGPSLARSIAGASIRPGAEEIAIEVPMASARAPAQSAYDRGAERIAGVLAQGRDVALLCEGDPLFYGSFMYLMSRLAGRFEVEVVPGVTSLGAGAAAAGLPLASRNEVLTVLPGPMPEDAMRGRLRDADSVVFIKVGRHLAKIRNLLEAMDMTANACYVEHASLAAERAVRLADAPETAPYFSMILVTKGGDPWLSNRL